MLQRVHAVMAQSDEPTTVEKSDGEGRRYGDLSREALIALLERRDRDKARIGLNWSADRAERDRALNDDFATLRLVEEQCDQTGPWRNLIIEGDNFDALRWLRMTMRGRVKCIFVDPPYNTGTQDWAYNDAYRDPTDPFHDTTWLEFLHRRFRLARDLLTDDGVIFVCINDDKRAILELMLDQTLPGMKLGSLVWRTRDTTSAADRNFSSTHEHVLVYAQKKFSFNGSPKQNKKYKNPDRDPLGPWNVDPLTLAFSRHDRPNLFYPLQDPRTDIWYPCEEDRVWAYASKDITSPTAKVRTRFMEEWVRDGFIVFPGEQDRVQIWSSIEEIKQAIDRGDVPKTPKKKTPLISHKTPNLDFWVGKKIGFGRPGFKKHWKKLRSHTAPLGSWVSRRNEIDFEEVHTFSTDGSGAGTNDLQVVFGRKAFAYPKPVSLVRELVRQSTSPDSLVLDFFAGSGTTAQAVMELNAEDGLNRAFVMVSHDEATTDDRGRNLARDVLAERVRLLNGQLEENDEGSITPFAYLKTTLISSDRLLDGHVARQDSSDKNLGAQLEPEDIWLAVQTMHNLPLRRFDPKAGLQAAGIDGVLVAFADEITDATIAQLRNVAAKYRSTHVYTWTPGPVRRALDRIDGEIHRLPDALWRAFKS